VSPLNHPLLDFCWLIYASPLVDIYSSVTGHNVLHPPRYLLTIAGKLKLVCGLIAYRGAFLRLQPKIRQAVDSLRCYLSCIDTHGLQMIRSLTAEFCVLLDKFMLNQVFVTLGQLEQLAIIAIRFSLAMDQP
jgi:hypothetical protein